MLLAKLKRAIGELTAARDAAYADRDEAIADDDPAGATVMDDVATKIDVIRGDVIRVYRELEEGD